MEHSQEPFHSASPPVGKAPPTAPGRPEPRRTVWPVALGVILFIFGALAALHSAWSAFAPWVLIGVAPSSDSAQRAQDALTVLGWLHYFFPIASLGLALLACYAGARLWRRHPRAVMLTRRWAIAKIVFAFLTASAGAYTQHTVMQLELSSLATPGPFTTSGLVLAMSALTFVFGIAWLSALPVFLLCWLASARVKADIARWAPPPSSGSR